MLRLRPSAVVAWAVLACAVVALAGCTRGDPGDPMTSPPLTPQGHVAGATLPRQVAGYSVLGALPVSGELTATYALDSDSSVLAVVTLWQGPDKAQTPLGKDEWFGHSRCGTLDEVDDVIQVACVTPLVDGVLTVVGSATQTPEDLAELANSVLAGLP